MSWMKWAGYMARRIRERLQKLSKTKKQEGCRKRGRPQLRWDDCVKRDRSMKGRGGRNVARKVKQQAVARERFFNRVVRPGV